MKSPPRILLELLSTDENSWLVGLEMVKRGASRFGLYVHLLRLEEAGFVRSRPLQPDSPRREYQITSTGRAALLRDDL